MMPHMLEDPDLKEFDYRMSKTITLMPEEVQDRFKALKCLYVNYSKRSYIINRMLSANLTRKRRHSTVLLSSSMTNSTRRSTYRETKSSQVLRHHRRSSLRSMRPVLRNSMTKTSRSWSPSLATSRKSRIAHSVSQASGCAQCSIMAVLPALFKRRIDLFCCTYSTSIAFCTTPATATTLSSPSRRMTTLRMTNSRSLS